jgi:hypothetical protein
MHETRNGSAHCPTPIEKPLLPACGASLESHSKHPGEGSSAAIVQNRFATAFSGGDLDNPAMVRWRTSGTVVVPRITGPIASLGST